MQQSAHAERGVKVKGAQSDKAWGGNMEGRAIWRRKESGMSKASDMRGKINHICNPIKTSRDGKKNNDGNLQKHMVQCKGLDWLYVSVVSMKTCPRAKL